MASSFTTTICNFGDVSGVWTMTNPKPPVQMVSWCHSCGLCRPADALEDERGNVCGADLVGSSHEFHGFHGFLARTVVRVVPGTEAYVPGREGPGSAWQSQTKMLKMGV